MNGQMGEQDLFTSLHKENLIDRRQLYKESLFTAIINTDPNSKGRSDINFHETKLQGTNLHPEIMLFSN